MQELEGTKVFLLCSLLKFKDRSQWLRWTGGKSGESSGSDVSHLSQYAAVFFFLMEHSLLAVCGQIRSPLRYLSEILE